MNNIPIIDISNLDHRDRSIRKIAINQLCTAFHDIGFVAIQGHGISLSMLNKMREQAIELFNRPLQQKLSLQVQQHNYRGYIPIGFFTPNGAEDKSADQYEAYKLHYEVAPDDPIRDHCSLYGPNKWPIESAQLQETVMAYWRECDRLIQLLLRAIADYFSVDQKFFEDAFDLSLSNMTLLHYPPAKGVDDSFGIHPHKDTDVLTILAPDPVGGLYVRSRGSQEWIAALAPDDALIVNVGDMLEIWSGGYFVSTPHKVVNPQGAHRYSFPYFAVPRYDVVIESFGFDETLTDKSSNNTHLEQRSMHCGNVSAKIWQSNWPDAESIDECYDPYTK